MQALTLCPDGNLAAVTAFKSTFHTAQKEVRIMVDIKFAYWIPNVSGGLVVSKIPQRTDWTFDSIRFG